MKKILLFLLIFSGAKIASAQYKPVDQGSALTFKIGNFGFDVNGTFNGFQGTINFDPKNLDNSNFDVSIDANTVNTDNSFDWLYADEPERTDATDTAVRSLLANPVPVALVLCDNTVLMVLPIRALILCLPASPNDLMYVSTCSLVSTRFFVS